MTSGDGITEGLRPFPAALGSTTTTKSIMYEIFHRTWWQPNPSWPDGREPGVGEPHHIGWADSEEEARQMCREWNSEHEPGHLSDKAEYSEGRFT